MRPAAAGDLDVIVAKRLEFLAAVRGADYVEPAGFGELTEAFLKAEGAALRLHSWLAEDDGATIGIVSMLLWPRPPQPEDLRAVEGYIINMSVDPTHRRRGVGRQLLAACLDSAEELGIRKFVLHATEDGRQLYADAGFVPKSNWMELPA